MTRPSRHRPPVMAHRLTLVAFVAALMTSVAPPSPARVSASVADNSCRNVPLSSALMTATSCRAFTSNGIAAAGVDAVGGDTGMLAVLTDQQRSIVRFAHSGSVHLTAATPAAVCVTDAAGHATAVDPATAETTTAALAACGARNDLVITQSNTSSAIAAQATASRPIPRAAASAAPAASYSYYVASSFVGPCAGTQTTACPLWQMGADESVPSGGAMIIVDFGAPCEDPSTHVPGVQTFFKAQCYPDSTIQQLFTRFLDGYEATHGVGTPTTIIAAGVSNSVNGIAGDPQTAPEMSAIGSAWFSNVIGPTTAGFAAPVTVWGALDAEQSSGTSWLGPLPTRAFVDGYTTASGLTGAVACSAANRNMLADFGDAVYLEPGFDRQSPSGWTPPGGWTVDDIYHVAYGASTACPIPEIYYDINAAEWASLSDYAIKHGHAAINFVAVMSENGYCSGNNCTEVANASWASLATWTAESIPYVTNIAWSISVSPGVLNALPTSQTTTAFSVTWQVASGVQDASYALFSSKDSGPWLVWDSTTSSQATFSGVAGHHYDFFIETFGKGFNNGGPSASEASTSVANSATASQPFKGLYAVDAYGGLRPASSEPLQGSAYWPGWKIARGMALNPAGNGGVVLDAFGGLHSFGNEAAFGTSAYWPGWDIARAVVLLPSNTGGYVLDGFGGLHPFGTATMPTTTAYWRGTDIAVALTLLPNGNGGYVLDGYGALHEFGSAAPMSDSAYWPGWNIARSVAITADGRGAYVVDGFGGIHQAGTAVAQSGSWYYAGWDIARSIVMVPGSQTSGWTVDGYGGFHPFGTAPGVNAYIFAPDDAVRGSGSA